MTKIVKKRTFKASAAVPESEVTAVLDRVQHYPGVVSAHNDDHHIIIKYVLGECSYRKIEQCLAELDLALVDGSLTRLRANWICFTEDNELANLTLPAGWQQHVQNLYLSLHASDRSLSR